MGRLFHAVCLPFQGLCSSADELAKSTKTLRLLNAKTDEVPPCKNSSCRFESTALLSQKVSIKAPNKLFVLGNHSSDNLRWENSLKAVPGDRSTRPTAI
jgi:hypothetical protein